MMTLYWSPASPYARKVRAVAREKGLAPQLQEVIVTPYADPEELITANPLGKVPTLLLEDGTALYDSAVICAFLDVHPQAHGPLLIPTEPFVHWTVRRAEALGDGAMDLAYNLTMEGRKPEGEHSPTTVARWLSQLPRTLDAMQRDLGSLPESCTLSHIAFAVALGYLDFRQPDIAWREGRPDLASWYQDIAKRPSLVQTEPE